MTPSKNTIALFFSLILFCACKSDYLPPQHESQLDGEYKRHLSTLKKAYQFGDDFQVALQLAYLKADADLVYSTLDNSLRSKPDNCTKLYSSLFHLEENKEKTKLVELDTDKFMKTMDLCSSLLGKDSYPNFKLKQEQEFQRRLAERPVLDSTLFDLDLVSELKALKQNHKEASTKEQAAANLKAVEAIINEHGYPSKETVGYGVASIIYEVLQAQTDLQIREKYQAFLAGNIGGSRMKIYKTKTNDLRGS